MPVVTKTITIETQGNNAVVDLNAHAHAAVAEAGIDAGLLVVFTPHTTAAVTALEFENGANRDLGELLERLVPSSASYHHNVADSNGHAHARAALMGPSTCVPVAGGRPLLGTWQHLALVDFDDRPRSRQVLFQVTG